MGENQLRTNAENLVTKLSSVLEKHAFQSSPTRWENEEVVKVTWVRQNSWKKDFFELSFRNNPSSEFKSVLVQLYVHIRTSESNDDLLDGVPIRALTKGESGSYDFPIFSTSLMPWRLRNLFEQIVSDAQNAITWFSSYDTPAKCLALLKTGKTVVGQINETGVARRISDHLARQS